MSDLYPVSVLANLPFFSDEAAQKKIALALGDAKVVRIRHYFGAGISVYTIANNDYVWALESSSDRYKKVIELRLKNSDDIVLKCEDSKTEVLHVIDDKKKIVMITESTKNNHEEWSNQNRDYYNSIANQAVFLCGNELVPVREYETKIWVSLGVAIACHKHYDLPINVILEAEKAGHLWFVNIHGDGSRFVLSHGSSITRFEYALNDLSRAEIEAFRV